MFRSEKLFILTLIILDYVMAFCSYKYRYSSSSTIAHTRSLTMLKNDLSFTELEEYAKYSGLTLKSSITGPYLKLEAFDSENTLVGYLSAFIRPIPFKLFHLDTIRVKNHRQDLGYKRKNWTIDGPGISFIMGTWSLIWAREQGCSQTELLAVRDSDTMHDILVRLYGSFGFQIKREVTENSTGDRLIWGAIGTLMSMNINEFFKAWTPKTRLLLEISRRKYMENNNNNNNNNISKET